MIFIGMCNNILIVLFSYLNFVKNPYSFLNQKIVIFAITESLFLLFFNFIDIEKYYQIGQTYKNNKN